MTRFQGALTSYRSKVAKGEGGFTLIELLVVVLIIGVLAAIAIPIYLSVQDSAKKGAAESAATEAKTAVVAEYTKTGTFPTTLTGVDGYAASSDITVTIAGKDGTGTPAADDFCIEATYNGSDKVASITNDTAVTDAACGA